MLKSLTILISIAATAYVGANKPDCANLEDGHYAVGCNRVFYRCYQKARYEHVCPEEDLYFDPQRIKCMEKDEVKQCKNERRYAGEIIKAKEFSCKGKKTGDYSHPAIPCDKYYYSCNHGVVHQMLCPPQQYFDERTKTCELKNNVRACLVRHRVAGYLDDPLQGGDDAGSPPGTLPASNSYSTNTGADMPGFEMKQIEVEQTSSTPDCVSRGDSVFEDPSSKCTDFFWKCAHSKLFKYHCPPGLFYDVEFNRCNYKQDIPSCGGTRPTPVTTQAPPAQDQAVIEFDCNDKKDGFYPVGRCKSMFVSCSAGSGRQVECSAGLFYDDRISACDYEDKCMGPRMPEKPLLSRPHGDIASDIPPEPKINYDCTGKPDGFYSLSDCNEQYVQCSNEIASVMKCAAGLVYSTYSLNCDYPQKCKETLELPPTTPLPGSVTVPATDFVTTTPKSNQYGEAVIIPTMSPTTPIPIVTESRDQTTKQGYDLPTYTPSSTTPPALPSNDDPTNFCATKSDGAYAKSVCSQEYVHCWDRLATPAKCHSDLIFNPYNGQCDYRSAVVDCNPGMDQPKTTTSAPSAPVEPFCEMLADGYYATGCSSTFYHCNNRVTRKMNCPPGLFFDTRRGICDRSHNIVACGGRSAAYAKTMPSSAYHQATSQDAAMPPAPGPMPSPSAYKPPRVIPTSDLTAPTFDCINRPDGIYALPTCTKFYAQCFGHQTKIQACAEGLWYNEQSGLCDYKERVPICGGSIPTGPAQNPPTATASPYGYNTQPTGFSCQGKADGYYSKGCAQFYYSCISGNTHAMTCPTGLKFSQTQQNCEDDAFVVECGGQPRPTSPALDKPTNLPLFSCAAEKTNGLFEIEKCHGEYAICEHGVYHLGRCLPMLVFNPVTLRCDFKQNTPTCGSMYVPTPAPQVTLPPVQHTSPIGSTECVGKLDGFYAMGACLPNYLQCLKQISYHAPCPSVLKFNPANGRCDFVANIPACSIVPTTSAQLQQQSVDVPSRPQAHY